MNVAIVEDEGYYRVKYTGIRTFPDVIAMLDEVAENAAATGVYKYLFDLRESEEGFSVGEKYKLGLHLAELFGVKYTVAVVMRKEHITGFLENVSFNRGAFRFMITDKEAVAIKHLQ